MADATLLTSERETFSMPVAESLCCGTPVVGFKTGGTETIAIPNSTSFCGFGDVDSLYDLLVDTINQTWDSTAVSNFAHEKYAKERMVENYLAIYEELLKKNKH